MDPPFIDRHHSPHHKTDCYAYLQVVHHQIAEFCTRPRYSRIVRHAARRQHAYTPESVVLGEMDAAAAVVADAAVGEGAVAKEGEVGGATAEGGGDAENDRNECAHKYSTR